MASATGNSSAAPGPQPVQINTTPLPLTDQHRLPHAVDLAPPAPISAAKREVTGQSESPQHIPSHLSISAAGCPSPRAGSPTFSTNSTEGRALEGSAVLAMQLTGLSSLHRLAEQGAGSRAWYGCSALVLLTQPEPGCLWPIPGSRQPQPLMGYHYEGVRVLSLPQSLAVSQVTRWGAPVSCIGGSHSPGLTPGVFAFGKGGAAAPRLAGDGCAPHPPALSSPPSRVPSFSGGCTQ